jgi:DnaA family protein
MTLDLGTPPLPSLDNFAGAGNAELLATLRGLDQALAAGPATDRTIYVWGEPGSGRSHLLQAFLCAAPPGCGRLAGPYSPLAGFDFDPAVLRYAVDDCDALSPAQQIAAFNLFNEVRAHTGAALLMAGNAAPLQLAVRDDLRSRCGWGLVFQLAALTDADKTAVLQRAAHERGIVLAADLAPYLLSHFRRDMPSLMKLFDALDRFSLEQKRAITLPLLRAMLADAADVPDVADVPDPANAAEVTEAAGRAAAATDPAITAADSGPAHDKAQMQRETNADVPGVFK